MNITNSELYDDDDEILENVIWILTIGFCIIIPCLYANEVNEDIPVLIRPFRFWFDVIIYILSYIYNKYLLIKKSLYNVITYCTPISVPHANIIYNISSENIPQNITIIYNNSIIVNAPTNDSHASVINKREVVIAEPINISEEIPIPHVTIV